MEEFTIKRGSEFGKFRSLVTPKRYPLSPKNWPRSIGWGQTDRQTEIWTRAWGVCCGRRKLPKWKYLLGVHEKTFECLLFTFYIWGNLTLSWSCTRWCHGSMHVIFLVQDISPSCISAWLLPREAKRHLGFSLEKKRPLSDAGPCLVEGGFVGWGIAARGTGRIQELLTLQHKV